MAKSVLRKPAPEKRKTGLKNSRKAVRSKRATLDDSRPAAGPGVASPQAMSLEESLARSVSDVEQLVRDYPLPALGAAATLGLLIGILMGRST